ncbi:SpaA isopeptide-forming pilin-related protein [Collinsella sp. HCP28S3_H5]|uniref:SpaA isopeptide-forming pilin-related protein n=1 Tax=unclassified Collinsella TaxID=2637548 RepID=UPI003F889F73
MRQIKRALAFALTFIMCVEALLGNGVASAVALTLEDAQSWQDIVQPFTETDAARESDDKTGSDAASGVSSSDSSDEASASASNDDKSDSNTSNNTTASNEDTSGNQDAVDVVPRDWSHDASALTVSSEGLAFDKRLGELAGAGPIEEIPVQLPASLNIKCVLNTALLEGDTFTVDLPAGLTFDLDSAKLQDHDGIKRIALYRLDAEGNTTRIRLGYAQLTASKLTVAFATPHDEQTDADLSFEAQESFAVDADVLLDSALLKDEESTLDWAIQQTQTEGVRTCELTIPARSHVEGLLGIDRADASSTVAVTVAGTSQDPVSAVTPVDSYGSKITFTTFWADNNNANRPSAEALQNRNEYRVFYSLDGGKTYVALTKDGDNLSDEAATQLGFTQETLDAAKTDGHLVSVAASTVSEYEASVVLAGKLPAKVVTRTDDGTAQEQPITYAISHVTAGGGAVEVKTGSTLYPNSNADPSQSSESGDYIVPDSSMLSDRTDYVEPYAKECLMMLKNVSFNVDVHIGNDMVDHNLSGDNGWYSRWGKYLTLTAARHMGASDDKDVSNINGDGLLQLIEHQLFSVTWNDNASNNYVISGRMPAYHPSGVSMKYRLIQQTIDNSGTSGYRDAYEVSYDNKVVPDYASDISACYSGGTMTVRHTGTTRFEATKVWLDDYVPGSTDSNGNEISRPAATYTLWRYSARPGNDARSAAQVVVMTGDRKGEFVKLEVTAEQNNKLGASYNSEDGSINNAKMDLGKMLLNKYGTDGFTQFAKYDPEGYPYIYQLRESTLAGYEHVFGKVDNEGNTSGDLGPNYFSASDTYTEYLLDGWMRSDSDNFGVYNGGTLTNRRAETVTVSAKKRWDIGAYQDQLGTVEVSFQLQRILKEHATYNNGQWFSNEDPMYGADGSLIGTYTWNDVADGRVTLNGWSAENSEQSFSKSGLPRYDELGNEYVYRWQEVEVLDTQDPDRFSALPTTPDGPFQFYGTFTDANGNQNLLFCYGEYDAKEKCFVNSYVDTVDATVDKYWQALDAEGNPIWTQDAKQCGNGVAPKVTVKVIRNDSLLTTIELDGRVDPTPNLQTIPGSSWELGWWETSPWHVEFIRLPKYDDNGSKYDYLFLEESVDGFNLDHTVRGIDPESRKIYTKFYNRPVIEGNASSSKFAVSKKWLDSGNAASRVPVEIGLYAKHDIVSQRDEQLAYREGELINKVTLNEENSWYDELNVPVGGLSKDDVSIRELSTLNSSDTPDDLEYEVIDRDTAVRRATYGSSEEIAAYGSLLRNWPETDTSTRMISKNLSQGFSYEVSYGENRDKNSLEVTNRRVGSVDISIDKTWADAGSAESKRPKAQITISAPASSSEFTFVCDNSRELFVRVAGKIDQPLKKKDSEGNFSSLTGSADASENTDVIVSEDSKSITFTVDVNKASSFFSVVGLPKYDLSGAIVDWKVEENIVNAGDYRSVGGLSSTDFGSPWHQEDQLNYSFTNKRTGTKDVTFHTKWFDHYVKDVLNQRPDVKLVLYRAAYTYDDNGNIIKDGNGNPVITLSSVSPSEYDGHFEWVSSDPADRLRNDTKGDFTQYATFKNLPKYDGNGGQYVYYARVDMNVLDDTKGALDYYDDDTVSKDSYTKDPGSWDKADDEVGSFADCLLADNDQQLVYREDSTFNFHIHGSVTVSGEKLWENVPVGYSKDDLPAISIYVQRRLLAGSYGANGNWTDGAALPWSGLALNVDDTQAKGYTVASSNTGKTDSGQEILDGKTAVAWTDSLEKDGNNWTFSIGQYGDNSNSNALPSDNKLAAYDAEGRRIEYRVREVIDGIVGKPGWDLKPESELDKAFDKVYDIRYTDFSIRNTYKSKQSKLTLHKVFTGRADVDTKYPDSTFRLYRYYVKDDDSKSALTFVAEQTLKGEDVNHGTESGAVTFDNLDIYAPSGAKWRYVAVEVVPNGYTATSGKGELAADASGFKSSDEWATANGVSLPTDVTGALSMGPTVVLKEAGTEPDVTFKNAYEPATATLTGKKIWQDRNNVFSTRPDSITIELTRKYQNGTLDEDLDAGLVNLQCDNPDLENYISWDKSSDTGSWTYTIKNLEKWAPDGTLWRYDVRETVTPYQYCINGNGGSCLSDPGLLPNITNVLNGQVGFSKQWDALDDWKQRPIQYFTLQAREAGTDSDWMEAGTFFTAHGVNVGTASSYIDTVNNIDTGLTCYTLSNGSGVPKTVDQLTPMENDGKGPYNFKSHWTMLPLSLGTGSSAVNVEYRVVESLLVYEQQRESKVKVYLDCDKNGNYSVRDSGASIYLPSQTEEHASGSSTWKSNITNELKGTTTSIKVRKTWDDGDNAWVTRPGTSSPNDSWATTFVLQRSSDGGDTWKWFTKYGSVVSSPFNDDSVLNGNLLTKVVRTADTDVSFDNLPAKGVGADATYQYRAVELVKGSYLATTAPSDVLATSADGSMRLELVPATADGGTQNYVNKLVTTSVSGTKTWNDWGSGLASTLDPSTCGIELNLYRKVEGGSEELVKVADATGALRDAAPKWTKNEDGTWTYEFTGLPQTDQNGKVYSYSVKEVDGSVAGWYNAQNNNGSLTNAATRLTFDKVEGGSGTGIAADTKLNGVKLEVLDSTGKKVATWSRDENGAVSVTVEDGYGKAGAGENAGWIVGLPAGEYKVHEAAVPVGHVAVADFTVKIGVDGVVTHKGVELDASAAKITVADPLYRSAFSLEKVYRHGDSELPVSGMTFDLYRGTYDASSVDGGGVKIAEIVTDADGKWSADGSVPWMNHDDAFGVLAGYFVRQSDGLPAGKYYLVETGESALTKKPGAAGAVKKFTLGDSGNTFSFDVKNDEFNAGLAIAKRDSKTNAAISGATFKLVYTPMNTTSPVEITGLKSGQSYALDGTGTALDSSKTSYASDGDLKVSGLKKGSYQLVEVAPATGYKARGDGEAVVATFDVADDQNGSSNVLAPNGGEAPVVTNEPYLGSVSMNKVDDNGTAVPGAKFKLQRRDGDNWIDVDGDVLVTVSNGAITVSDLAWGTYRFVEVAPADGYYVGSGTVATNEITISASNVEGSVTTPLSCGTVTNHVLGLKIRKVNYSHDDLPGARFVVRGEFADRTTSKELVTDANGLASLGSAQLIVGNTYTVTETEAPAGYKIGDGSAASASCRFTVKADGTFAADGTYTDTVWSAAGTGTLELTMKDTANAVSLSKADASSHVFVSGATFTVYGKFSDTGEDAKTVQPTSGAVTLSGLIGGEIYRIEESVAPAGYGRLSSSLYVKFDAAGSKLSVVDAQGNALESVPSGWEIAENEAIAALDSKTRLSFNKVDAAGNGTGTSNSLNGVTLELLKGSSVVASWSRDENGNVSVSVKSGYGEAGSDADAGVIFGLSAGVYTVREPRVPAGHLAVSDFKVKIDDEGKVSLVDAPEGVSLDDHGVTVTVADPLYRSAFSLKKVYRHGSSELPVAGMSFELYRGAYYSSAANGGGIKIADIMTDANGKWSADGSVPWMNHENAFGVLAGYFVRQSDGLPAGEYYLVETGESALTKKPDGAGAVTEFTLGDNDRGAVKAVKVTNGEFNAQLEIHKQDALTRAPVNGAAFELRYTPLGSTDAVAIGGLKSGYSYALNAAGTGCLAPVPATPGALRVTGLKKGNYQLVETAPAIGYGSIGADDTVVREFKVLGGSDALANVISDPVVDNAPLLGSVSMRKVDVDGSGIESAQFKLQRLVGGDWTDVAGGLYTTDADGRITVTGLAWGTYRFAEVAPAAGFYMSGSVTTKSVTVGADNVAGSIVSPLDCGTVTNKRLGFGLVKLNDDGEHLSGARFTVTGEFSDGSAAHDLVTAADGTASLPDGLLVAGETYTVTETAAPEGYKIGDGSAASASVSFRVGSDGSFTAVGDYKHGIWSLSGTGRLSLAMKDRANSVSLSKADAATGDFVAGATFTVTGRFSDSADGSKTVSPVGGAVELRGLINGEVYRVEETAAPAGYGRLDAPLYVRFDDRGERLVVVDKRGAALSRAPEGWDVADGRAIVANNVRNRLTFDKVEGGSGTGAVAGSALNGVAFELSSGSDVVATWARSDEGVVSTTVASGYGESGSGADAGWLVGLPAGTYRVHESVVPAGHVAVADFTVKIDAEGVVTLGGAHEGVELNASAAKITVADPLYRSAFSLEKVYRHGSSELPVAGMTFDLYRGTYHASSVDGGGVKIAAIVTDADGKWSADGSVEWLNRDGAFGSLAGYFVRQSDGLPAGDYYLVETGESALTKKPGAAGAVTEFTLGGSDRGTTKAVKVENDEFNAGLAIEKRDAATGSPVNGAGFELVYTPLGKADSVTISGLKTGCSYVLDATGTQVAAHSSNADGCLKVTGLKKGGYRLIETVSATGYAPVAPGGSLVSSFDVLDAANGVGNVLATADGSAPVVTNEPLLGSVSMRKVDEGGQPIAGATFKLQLKSGSDWVDVGDGRATDTDGSIVVTGLAWGTYRFVEVAPAAGYYLDREEVATNELTVTADNVAGSIELPLDCGTVTNTAFALKLLKRNGSGDALPGAVFTVEGRFADGSSVVELTSGDDGIASLGSAQLVAGETYTVTETAAPAGYMIGDGTASSASFSFSVAADGSWSAVGESNPAVWSMSGTGSLELAVTDKAHTVSRSKDGMPGTGDSLFAVSDALATLGLMALAIGLRRTRRRS